MPHSPTDPPAAPTNAVNQSDPGDDELEGLDDLDDDEPDDLDDLDDLDDDLAAARPRAWSSAPGSEGPFPRLLPLLYVIGGAVGLAAAFVLMVEKVELLINPEYVPSCNLNPIISCGSVMKTGQAAAFGFPNPLLGVAGFAVVLTIGAALFAGATFRRWFWLGLQAGTVLGVIFVHWLMYQTLYRIGAVCPYCVVVWLVTIPTFLYTTLHNLDRGHLPVGDAGRKIAGVLTRYHATILTAWIVMIVVLIGSRFWSYWSTLL
ncbi:vitamin K epoxide reductase family protein [Actinopolymorpha sp. NPDC004070]|uniref:vitamin K epoxide reductase family protein n=1 Tax=Actinopolymorpha sp. NPDC004070 TaxID=3154548 RepID=UPI0033AC81B9